MGPSPCSWRSKRPLLSCPVLPPSFWSSHSDTITLNYIHASLHSRLNFLSISFVLIASATSALPPQSTPASAVPAPGGTSCRIFARAKTSRVAARDSLTLIRLPILLTLTQASSRPLPLTHQIRWLVPLALRAGSRCYLRLSF